MIYTKVWQSRCCVTFLLSTTSIPPTTPLRGLLKSKCLTSSLLVSQVFHSIPPLHLSLFYTYHISSPLLTFPFLIVSDPLGDSAINEDNPSQENP